MANRIREIHVHDTRLDPVEAEVWISVYPERLTSQTQVRGRLVGPRCTYANTVEVAYPLREHSREYESTGIPHITTRVIIPEPCPWEPQTPFLYQGQVELWQSGQRCDHIQLKRGLRSLTLGPPGLRLNGRPFTIRGIARDRFVEEDLSRLRQEGFNTLLTLLSADSADLWSASDRLGFFMLGRMTNRESIKWSRQLVNRPSVFGWLIPEEAEEPEVLWLLAPGSFPVTEGYRLGCELKRPLSEPLPEDCSFVYCEKNFLPVLDAVTLPKLLRIAEPPDESAMWQTLLVTPGIMGWVWEPSE